jgi:hypothetical protein
MKICPRCQKTYTDDNLNFCLEDGSVLTVHSPVSPMADTVMMPQAPPTQPQPQPQQPGWNVAPQQQPPPQPQYAGQQPKKKSSKAWIWIVLILVGAMLLCGGGAAALIFWAANQPEFATNKSTPNNRSSQTSNKTTNSTTTTSSTSDRDDVETVDLSGWKKEFSVYGVTEYTDGEFIMSSKNKGYYYVLVAPDEYKTDDADTRVTVRNVDNMSSSLGYGLIFHSNPTPLQQDYAFLIDTKRKKYRVVHHEPQKASSVVSWTSSSAINEGSAENVLEARDLPDKIELYINGTMVTSIKNIYGYPGGVPGLYSGDGAKAAFKDLEIRK